MKRTFQPSKRNAEINTDLESAWHLFPVVRYWRVAVLKGEKRFLFHLSRVIKNND